MRHLAFCDLGHSKIHFFIVFEGLQTTLKFVEQNFYIRENVEKYGGYFVATFCWFLFLPTNKTFNVVRLSHKGACCCTHFQTNFTMRLSSRSSSLFRASPFGILAIVFLLFTNPANAQSERESSGREIAGPPTALINNNAKVVITHLSLLDVSRQREIQERKLKHWRVNKGVTDRKRKYKGRKQDDDKREGKKNGKGRKWSKKSTKGYTRQHRDDSCMPLNDPRDLLEDGTSHRWLMTNRNEKKWRHWQGPKKQEKKYYKYKKKETKPKTSAPVSFRNHT